MKCPFEGSPKSRDLYYFSRNLRFVYSLSNIAFTSSNPASGLSINVILTNIPLQNLIITAAVLSRTWQGTEGKLLVQKKIQTIRHDQLLCPWIQESILGRYKGTFEGTYDITPINMRILLLYLYIMNNLSFPRLSSFLLS